MKVNSNDKIGVPESIVKQLKKSLNSSEYTLRKQEAELHQRNQKGEKLKQSSFALKKTEHWNDFDKNECNLKSFDQSKPELQG